jgi:hypothetical protein
MSPGWRLVRARKSRPISLRDSSSSRSSLPKGAAKRSLRKMLRVISSARAFQSRKVCASRSEKRAIEASVSSRSRENTRPVPSRWGWANS